MHATPAGSMPPVVEAPDAAGETAATAAAMQQPTRGWRARKAIALHAGRMDWADEASNSEAERREHRERLESHEQASRDLIRKYEESRAHAR